MRGKLLTLLVSLAMVLVMMPMTALAEDEHTVKLEFGAGHEDFVKKVFDVPYNISGEGSYTGILISKAEEGATCVYVKMDRNNAGVAHADLEDALNQIFSDNSRRIDGELRLMRNIGIQSSYESWEEFNEEADELYEKPYTDIETFYALWEEPAELDLTVAPPECGTTVSFVGSGALEHTEPAVEVTATDVECIPNKEGGSWFAGKDSSSFFTGKIEGGQDYYGKFQLQGKFGYYIPEEAYEKMTISGATVISKEYSNGNPIVQVKVTAAHVEDDPVIVDPTCTEPGSKTYTCTGCGNKVEETIDALGHDWGEWEVTKVATVTEEGEETRVCGNDPSHKETHSIPKLDPDNIVYQNTDGDGLIWIKGSGIPAEFTFERSVNDGETYSHFTGIRVDGNDVDDGDYSAVPGSVVVSLQPSFLETLALGDHTLTAMFDDGNDVDAEFTVLDEEEIDDSSIPSDMPIAGIEDIDDDTVAESGDSYIPSAMPSAGAEDDGDDAEAESSGATSSSVKTGDNENLVLWASIMAVALAAMVGMMVVIRRRI